MGIKDEEMTEEEARQKAIKLIRNVYYPNKCSKFIDDDFILLNFCDEYNWFMQGWKEESIIEKCNSCGSNKVELIHRCKCGIEW